MTHPTPTRTARLTSRVVDSPLGPLTLVASRQGLRAVLWPAERPDRVRLDAEPVPDRTDPLLEEAEEQLSAYFAGGGAASSSLDPIGTEFQRSAWLALAEIPFASTTTYAAQAARLGRPRAVRAVGAANGRNPLSIVLPCHRVVGTRGDLVGFAGGLAAKRYLLDHEADLVAGDGVSGTRG